jgi:hypothetical protein
MLGKYSITKLYFQLFSNYYMNKKEKVREEGRKEGRKGLLDCWSPVSLLKNTTPSPKERTLELPLISLMLFLSLLGTINMYYIQ